MPVAKIDPPQTTAGLFDDDEDGWLDMPVVREDKSACALDEEDQKKYHYVSSAKGAASANATGNFLDVDDFGRDWRSKAELNEGEYTRLRVNEEDDADEVHMRTKYLFDEDKAMTPLSQMQATKNLLTEAQRVAYVGLCSLTSREMSQSLKLTQRKELKPALQSMDLWALKIMGRLYYHMELETQEQKMIESLASHGVQAMDLVSSLMTTHTVANPEYDPAEARKKQAERNEGPGSARDDDDDDDDPPPPYPPPKSPPVSKSTPTTRSPVTARSPNSLAQNPKSPSGNVSSPTHNSHSPTHNPHSPTHASFQTTARVLQDTTTAIPGVSTSLSSTDEIVTLDIRWTVLCDLFLILIADSVYDARSRVLLENVALKLGLGWLDVVKFEARVTEALEIQEGVERMEHQDLIDGRQKAAKKRRYMMLGLATLGGGLVIGLSAGLLAPVIGAGLGAAFTTIGITGTSTFLAGAGGAAVITTGGVLTGSGIAANGMAKRTKQVRTFDILPLHNNKRVSCILTVPGFMNGKNDDVRLPFSVLDPIVGDVFSILWEPEMIRETGGALKILTGEVLTQLGQTVLAATVMTALMSALQWPIILTKLGYLIDNPWNNALDRAKAAGGVLADVLMHRSLGVRPITLIGFSLGARVIFYALLELAKHKAFGIVQDVFLMGATLTVSQTMWFDARSVVSGRFVNAYARNDWVLNYLFRATGGGIGTVAGLRPIEGVAGLENVDVTDKISGHMSYRSFMPLILDQLGFPVSAGYFDEPEEPDFEEDRIVVREEDEPKKKGWFSRKKTVPSPQKVSRPPTASNHSFSKRKSTTVVDEDLPPREHRTSTDSSAASPSGAATPTSETSEPAIPLHAGFDFSAIKEMIGKEEGAGEDVQVPVPRKYPTPSVRSPALRSASAPGFDESVTPRMGDLSLSMDDEADIGVIPSSASRAQFGGQHAFQSLPARSVSVSDVREDREANFSDREEGITPRQSPTLTGFNPHLYSFSSSSASSSWSAQANPFATSGTRSETLSVESFGGSVASFGGVGTGYTPPATNASALERNPFALSSASSALSFGGSDGSITSAPTSVDPWDTRKMDNKKFTAFGPGSNPWS